MRRHLATFGLTLAILAALDAGVAGGLHLAESHGRFGSIVRYFDYGLSVPGKLAFWRAHPGIPYNLYDVSWRQPALEASLAGFKAEPADEGPVVRTYGMSFVERIMNASKTLDPDLRVDFMGGPAAPPNYTYAQFLDDRPARRKGDIVVLGVLSSTVYAMTSLSNRTWNFEQPAPLTYPIFLPDPQGEGLVRTEPLVETPAEDTAAVTDPALGAPWRQQLRRDDRMYTDAAFAAPWLDASPFLRLVRRAAARSAFDRARARVLDPAGPTRPQIDETMRRMFLSFDRIAREDGQIPVVMLIAGRAGDAPDLKRSFVPFLEDHGIRYFATQDHADPADPSLFQGDGHYRGPIDAQFAHEFLKLLSGLPGTHGLE